MYGDGDDTLDLPFCLHFLSSTLHSTLSQPGVKRLSLEKVS